MSPQDKINSLSGDERQVLVKIEGTRKSKVKRIFSESDLILKLPENFNLQDILRSLQNKGIVQIVDAGKRLWMVVDKVVEHDVKMEEMKRTSGLSRILKRG